MHAYHRLRTLAAAAALATLSTAAAAGAAAGANPPAAEAACELPRSTGHPLTSRESNLQAFERMPRPCLERLFHGCTDAARAGLLDFGSASTCSIGYEALLKQGFGGDFQALLAWWRTKTQSATVTAR